LIRPVLVEPREFVIVEGLLPLHTRLAQAAFDITVYLDPPEEIRREWKIRRDTRERGYSVEAAEAELARRDPESESFIRPQRRWADIVVRFAPVAGRDDPAGTPLSAELMLRPTIEHPELAVFGNSDRAMHLKLLRDTDGRPVDALHVHGYVPEMETAEVVDEIWGRIQAPGRPPDELGRLLDGSLSGPLAVTQLLLLAHLLAESRQH
jgi:phosphoribulokinase